MSTPVSDGFSSNRALHSLGVARLMRRLAPSLGLDADEMALLGWLHDFGYMLGDPDMHAETLGRLLGSYGYPYAGEVQRHGSVERIDWSSPVDVLLNGCDMSVSGDGRLVSFGERLVDVAARWGAGSRRVAECRRVCARLGESGLWVRASSDICVILE